MGDDAGLPKMVKQWLHVHFCKQWSWAMISILGNARQCQALPRALQASTKFSSEYSSEQCSALSGASTFPLILTCASVNAWHDNTKHYFSLHVLIFWLVCLLHCSKHWRFTAPHHQIHSNCLPMFWASEGCDGQVLPACVRPNTQTVRLCPFKWFSLIFSSSYSCPCISHVRPYPPT